MRFPLGDTAFEQVPQPDGSVLLRPGVADAVTVQDLAGNQRLIWSAESGGSSSATVSSDSEGDLNGWVDMPDFDIVYADGTRKQVRLTAAGFANVMSYGALGDGVADDYPAFVAAYNALPTLGGTILIPPGTYLTSATFVISKPVRMIGAGIHTGGNKVPSVIRPAAGVTGIQIGHSLGPASKFESFGLWSRSTGAGSDDGFLNYAHGVVWDHILIQGFGNNGLSNISTGGIGNCNNFSCRNVRTVGNFGHGFYATGVDSNAGSLFDCEASGNGGWGYFDESFLGNSYFGCLSESNTLGGTHTSGGVNVCRFYGHYSEAGQGSGNDINHPSLVFPTGTTTNIGDAAQLQDSQGNLRSTKPIEVQNNDGTVFSRLGFGQANQGILEFEKTGEGSYYLQFANSGFEFRESNASTRAAFALTGTNDSAGPGFARMPRGFFMTGSTTLGATNPVRRYVGNSDAIPTTGTWNRGDILYNTLPSAGGKVGWVCTASGTPGTWKGFGAIDP